MRIMSIRQFGVILIAAILPAYNVAWADEVSPAAADQSVWRTVKADYNNFYLSDTRWTRLGIAFGAGAVLANTDADQGVRDWYQQQLRGSTSDHYANYLQKPGEGKYVVPLALLAAATGTLSAEGMDAPLAAWGQRTCRAYLAAWPATLVAERLTGGSRPEERSDASRWRPFRDDNGLSGHAFLGAVPFLTIAHMSDHSFVQYGAYVASTFAAWSRINDDKHYLSQVFLGWYLAYEAADAVAQASRQQRRPPPRVSVIPWRQGLLVEAAYRW